MEKTTHVGIVKTIVTDFQNKLARELSQRLLFIQQTISLEPKQFNTRNRSVSKIGGPATGDSEQFVRVWVNFPRKLPFYESTIVMLGTLLQQSSFYSVLPILLSWLPECSNMRLLQAYALEEFKYSTFERKIVPQEIRSGHIDLIKRITELVIADFISYLIGFYDGTNMDISIMRTLWHVSASFQVFPELQSSGFTDYLTIIQESISKQWSCVFSALTAYTKSPPRIELIYRLINTKKESDLLAYYQFLKKIQLCDAEAHETFEFIILLCDLIDNSKSKPHRYHLIEILTAGIRSVNLEGNAEKDILQLVEKKTSKWIKIDELHGVTLRLRAVCIAHSSQEHFQKEYDSFVKKVLGKINRKANYGISVLLDAILVLLQGQYKGERQEWLPSSRVPHFHTPLWTHASSLPFCPLNDSTSLIQKRLIQLNAELFQGTTLKIVDKEANDKCVAIGIQISAHNLQFTNTGLIPKLFIQKPTGIDYLLGFRIYNSILEPNGIFQQHADLNAKQYYATVKMDFKKRLNSSLDEICSLVAPSLSSYTQCAFYPIHYYSEKLDFVAIDFGQSRKPILPFHTERERKALLRLKRRMKSGYYPLGVLQYKKICDERVTAMIHVWGASCQFRISHLPLEPSLLPDLAVVKLEYKDRISIEIIKHFLMSLRIGTTISFWSTLSDHFIGHLLLHPDLELASITSGTLQYLLYDYPEYRALLINEFFLLAKTVIDTARLETYLAFSIFLLDICVAIGFNERNTLPEEVRERGESIALVCLCHHSTTIRLYAMQLIDSIYACSSPKEECLSKLLAEDSADILEKARFRYLLYCANGTFEKVKIKQAGMLSIEEIATGENYVLWSFVLTEICVKVITKQMNCVIEARSIIFDRVSYNINLAMPEASCLAMTNQKALRINYHIFLFATSDNSRSGSIPKLLAFHEYLCEGSSCYITNLHSENDTMIQEMLLTVNAIHHSSIHQTMISLHKFIGELGKKTKFSVILHFALFLRHLMGTVAFSRIIKEGDIGCCSVTLQILEEIAATIDGAPSKVTALPLFISFAQSVTYFCNALQRTHMYCQNGPLRMSFYSSVMKGFNWSPLSRSRFASMFQLFSSAKSCTTADILLAFKLKGTKDKEVKQKDERIILKQQEYAKGESDLAFVSLIRIGELFTSSSVSFESLEMATRLEPKYRCISSLLSFHFSELLPRFVNHCYKHEKSALYLRAILDQFINPADLAIPSWCISSDAIKYQKNMSYQDDLIPKREIQPTNKHDHGFAETVLDNVGMLLFLFFINLLHPDIDLRHRILLAIHRLVPIRFGAETSQPPSSDTIRTAQHLSEVTSKFKRSQNIVHASKKACKASSITAEVCTDFTPQLFCEAFARMPIMTCDTMKLWALEILLPWCTHLDISSAESSSSTLQSIFDTFTTILVMNRYRLPQECILFWQKLATAKVENQGILIEFLISRDEKMISRSLLYYLFELDPRPPFITFIERITYSSCIAFFQKHSHMKFDFLHSDCRGELLQYLTKCGIIITVLSDFVVDNIVLVLPYIHTILTWCLLFYNSSQHEAIVCFLSRLMEVLYQILSLNNIGDGDLLERLRHISLRLADPFFELHWNYTVGLDTGELFGGRKESPELLDPSISPLEGKEVVEVIRKTFFLMEGENLAQKWADEALLWCCSPFNPTLVAMSLEIYTTLGFAGRGSSDCSGISKLLYTFMETTETFQSSTDQYVVQLLKASSFMECPVAGTLKRKIFILRGIIIQILIFFGDVFPSLMEECLWEITLHIFWCIVSILRVSNSSAFSAIQEYAWKLADVMSNANFFKKIPTKYPGIREQMHTLKQTSSWLFTGFLPFALYRIYVDTTLDSFDFLATLLANKRNKLVSTSQGGKIDILAASIVSLLPWLYVQLLIPERSDTVNVAYVLIDKLLAAQKKKSSRRPRICTWNVILERYIAGEFKNDPSSFLKVSVVDICSTISASTVQEISGLFAALLHAPGDIYQAAIIDCGFLIVEECNANVDDSIDEFSNLIKFAARRVGSKAGSVHRFSGILCTTNVRDVSFKCPSLKIKRTFFTERFPTALHMVLHTTPLVEDPANMEPAASTKALRDSAKYSQLRERMYTCGELITQPTTLSRQTSLLCAIDNKLAE